MNVMEMAFAHKRQCAAKSGRPAQARNVARL